MWAAAAAVLPLAFPSGAAEVRDLYFGEALFHAHQEEYFEALERLDAEIAQHRGVDEPHLDSLHPLIDHAEFSVGDFELRYRMHHRAGRAIRAVLEGDVEEPVRNEAAYRLARIHFQKDQPLAALHALDRISGELPRDLEDDVEFLRANVYLALGRSDDATEVLSGLDAEDDLEGFSAYNLGIALLQGGHEREALSQLDRAGQADGSHEPALAIRDKSNLVLGTLLFEASEFERAQASLDRVRLEGPFSNQALLRSGWSAVSAGAFDRAVVPWSLLAQRAPTDAAVQEVILALPYAYSKLAVHGRAAHLYGRAVEVYGEEIEKLDASLESVREGHFLEALVREEIRQDKDWVIHLRRLPDAPETFYLISLMASHDFQTALQNYLDLEDLRKKMRSWERGLDAFEDVIAHRRAYYEPLLPGLDEEFRRLDSRIRLRLEQRQFVDQRLQHLLIAPRPEYLARSGEQQALARLELLEAALAPTEGSAPDPTLLARVKRLQGVLGWTLETDYHRRLTEAHENLRELNRHVDAMQARYESFVRARQAATHSYVGYEDTITRLRSRIDRAQEDLEVLMARQGHLLEKVAQRELEQRRARLEGYLDQARFAFADSYDRAAKAQLDQ